MFKFLKYLIEPILNNRGDSGGDDEGDRETITEIRPSGKTEREFLKKQLGISRSILEQAREQGELAKELGPIGSLITKRQARAGARQTVKQRKVLKDLREELGTQVPSSELEKELIQRQMEYAKGEIPELGAEQKERLGRITELQEEQALEDILRKQETGMRKAKDIAIATGSPSSSIREQLEDVSRVRALRQAGDVQRQLGQVEFQTGYQLPQQRMGQEIQMSQYEQSLAQQAEANRRMLAQKLQQNIQSPFVPLGTFLQSQIPGTYFRPGSDAPDLPESDSTVSPNKSAVSGSMLFPEVVGGSSGVAVKRLV